MSAPALPRTTASARPDAWLHPLLIVVALPSVIVPIVIVRSAPSQPPARAQLAAAPVKVVPPAEVPAVDPVRLRDLTPEDARIANAAVPFVAGPNPPAKPYHFSGSEAERARAVDCMAVGVLYEAGDDTEGERAVAQVVLNRLHHPAFPKTVCGVVFQGAERTTGCQFTFTCDGALARHSWPAAAWTRARDVAGKALSGAVYKPVGYATHYHTDWVVPYWSASLDKVAAVGSHLFFRWTGWWGTPPAFRRHPDGAEPVIAQLASISPAHAGPLETIGGNGADTAAAVPRVATYAPVPGDPDSFLITLPKTIAPALLPAFAQALCADRAKCKVMGWTDPARTPRALPLSTGMIATMAFSYLHDEAAKFDRPLWNCRLYQRPARDCMKRQMVMGGAAVEPRDRPAGDALNGVAPASSAPRPADDVLAGVRRIGGHRPEAAAAPAIHAPEPLLPLTAR